jgi:hypothetical protein
MIMYGLQPGILARIHNGELVDDIVNRYEAIISILERDVSVTEHLEWLEDLALHELRTYHAYVLSTLGPAALDAQHESSGLSVQDEFEGVRNDIGQNGDADHWEMYEDVYWESEESSQFTWNKALHLEKPKEKAVY